MEYFYWKNQKSIHLVDLVRKHFFTAKKQVLVTTKQAGREMTARSSKRRDNEETKISSC